MENIVIPCSIVSFVALIVVTLESMKIFGRDVAIVVFNRWGWILLMLNIVVALLVYAIARLVFKAGPDGGTALLVALTFPMILRSRFTYFRAAGVPENDWTNALTLKIDEFYDMLQNLCMTSVREALANKRASIAELLANSFQKEALARAISNYIGAYTFTKDEERDLYQRLKSTLEIEDEWRSRYELAMMILNNNPSKAKEMLHDAQLRDTKRLDRR